MGFCLLPNIIQAFSPKPKRSSHSKPIRVQAPEWKVPTQNHDYDSQYRNPTYPQLGYFLNLQSQANLFLALYMNINLSAHMYVSTYCISIGIYVYTHTYIYIYTQKKKEREYPTKPGIYSQGRAFIPTLAPASGAPACPEAVTWVEERFLMQQRSP